MANKRILITSEKSGLEHYIDVPDDSKIKEVGKSPDEPTLGSPDVKKVFGGVDDSFNEVVNEIHQRLLEYSRDFLQTKSQFRLREVTPILDGKDGRFTYDLVLESGQMFTYRARWYYLSGTVTIDLSEQTQLQNMSEGEEPPLGSIDWGKFNKVKR